MCQSVQPSNPAYELGPDLLAAQKLSGSPVAGMAFGGEAGPDPSKFDIMVGDDLGVWQNKTMESSPVTLVEQSTIPGYSPTPLYTDPACSQHMGSTSYVA